MRTRTLLMSVLAVLALVGSGCRGGSSNPDSGPGGDGGGDDNTVQEVQSSAMAVGTVVELHDVVVVGIDTYGTRTGGIYVMEPGGGAYSGVYVYLYNNEAASLAVGDLVDIDNAAKDEFQYVAPGTTPPPCERDSDCTLTELGPPATGSITVTKVGTGTVPEPELLNPWDLALDDTEAEKWEGVLVEFEGVEVLYAPDGVSTTDTTLKEMTVTGPFRVSSSLAELADTIERGYCFQNIIGIGDYFFEYKILPRSASDLGSAGSNCPAPEEGDTACGDEVDNDHDGFADCADFSCQESVAACTNDATVVECQDGTYPLGAAVNLSEVVVTAIDRDRLNLWVQDEDVDAQHNGLYVFRGKKTDASPPTELDSNIQVGQRVDVTGSMDEYFTSTQLNAKQGTVTHVTGGAATLVFLSGADASTLSNLTTGDPWDSALVEFTNIEVLTDPDQYGELTIGTAGSPLYVDNTLFSYGDTLSTGLCLASIKGVVIMDTYETPIPRHFFLAPRSAADIQTGGTCD